MTELASDVTAGFGPLRTDKRVWSALPRPQTLLELLEQHLAGAVSAGEEVRAVVIAPAPGTSLRRGRRILASIVVAMAATLVVDAPGLQGGAGRALTILIGLAVIGPLWAVVRTATGTPSPWPSVYAFTSSRFVRVSCVWGRVPEIEDRPVADAAWIEVARANGAKHAMRTVTVGAACGPVAEMELSARSADGIRAIADKAGITYRDVGIAPDPTRSRRPDHV